MVALCHPFPMRSRLWLGISVLVVLLATAPGVQAHGDEVVPFDETIPAGAAVDGTPTSMSPHGNLSVPEDARRAHLRLNWTPTTGTDPALRLAVLDGPSSITGEQVIVSQTGKSPLQLSVPVDDVETLGWRVQAHDGLAANQYVQGKAHFEASPPEDPDASPDATDEPRTASQPTPESSGPDTSAPLAAESVAHGAALAGLLVVLLRRLDRPLGVLLGLYSRLSDDEIAEHPQRHRILSLLEDEPGLHLGALARALDLSESTLRHHLAKLEEADLVVRREADGYTCYFRPGTDPREREALARLRSPTAEAILSALCSGNHDSQRAVARALDLAPSTVSYHVGRLRDAGLLADEGHEGRRVTPLAREILARLDRQ